MNYLAFESNAEFNPLFEKMRERFCANGTIAEQLAKRASEHKKTKSKRVTAEHHMTTANSLPKTDASQAKAEKRRNFFSLRSISSACMLLLVAGTVLFSGAAIGSLRAEKGNGIRVLKNESSLSEDTLTLFEDVPAEYQINL